MPLYVFLHGLFVVSETAQPPLPNPLAVLNPTAGYLKVVLPEVDGHVYRAGGWLAETEIAPGNEMYLCGVQPGGATFGANNFTIDLPQTSLSAQNIAATFWLYKPDHILSLLHAFDSNYVVRATGGGKSFNRVATVQVLVYDQFFQTQNDLMLQGHTWEPCATGDAISLHIISTSPEPEGKAHEIHTDGALRYVLLQYPGLDFQDKPRPLAAPWIDPNNPTGLFGDFSKLLQVQGDHFLDNAGGFAFLHAELEHLILRTARLGRLGRLKQSGQPIEGVWTDPDPLADRASNCATIKTS